MTPVNGAGIGNVTTMNGMLFEGKHISLLGSVKILYFNALLLHFHLQSSTLHLTSFSLSVVTGVHPGSTILPLYSSSTKLNIYDYVLVL